MTCMLSAILIVLAHESVGKRASATILENALAAEFEDVSEVLVAENDSASLRLKPSDEFVQSGNKSTDISSTCHDREETMEVLQTARGASASSDELAGEYMRRFLLTSLCTTQKVQQVLFKKSDINNVDSFLRKYIAWAKEREWKILHEFSVDDANVVIVGDLHGHFATMRAAFRVWLGRLAAKPSTHLIFLGDFVDRGKRDVEMAIAIMALQMWMGGPVIVLRGNHEHEQASEASRYDRRSWTFAKSLSSTFADGAMHKKIPKDQRVMNLWNLFADAFWNLPAAAIVARGSKRYLMLHGGWTESVLDNQETLKRSLLSTVERPHLGTYSLPEENSKEKLIQDLVWSDVMHQSIEGKYGNSSRGAGIATYGYDAIRDMFKALDVDWCISGHKHQNLLWMPPEELSDKGHLVVVSADRLRPRESAKLVVIENPPGLVCCCWTEEIKNNAPTEESCKHRFTQDKMCCKYKAGSSCTGRRKLIGQTLGILANKYRTLQDPTICGVRPSFEELSPLIPKYTLVDDITEGCWSGR